MFEWRSSANEFPYRNYIMCLQILIESLFQLNEDVNEKATKGSLEQEESFSSSRKRHSRERRTRQSQSGNRHHSSIYLCIRARLHYCSGLMKDPTPETIPTSCFRKCLLADGHPGGMSYPPSSPISGGRLGRAYSQVSVLEMRIVILVSG